LRYKIISQSFKNYLRKLKSILKYKDENW